MKKRLLHMRNRGEMPRRSPHLCYRLFSFQEQPSWYASISRLLQYACQQMDRASTQLPTIRFVGVYTHSDRGTYIRTIHSDAAQPYVRLTIVCALVRSDHGRRHRGHDFVV